MPHPFDAANKHLIQPYPADWNDLAGLPRGTSLDVVDADLSTISAAADKLIRVNGPKPYAAHHEFQSGWRNNLDLDMLLYNVLARRILGLSVKSVVFALRPGALSGLLGGVFDTEDPAHKLEFGYKVIRVWELPPDRLLSGGLGTLPLAPISAVTEAQLPAVIEAVARRFEAEAPPQEVPELWAVTRILMGIRWPKALIHQLMRGARQMKDSVVYQEILEEGIERGIEKGIERGIEKGIERGIEKGIEKGIERGRVAEAQSVLFRRGAKRLGTPDAIVQSRLEGIVDLSTLEELTDRMLDGSFATWAELLGSMA